MQPGEHSVSEQELHKLACNNAPTITHFLATLSSPKTPENLAAGININQFCFESPQPLFGKKGKRKHLPSITSLFHDHDGRSKRLHQSGQEVIYIDDEDIEVQGNNAGSAPKFSDQQPSKSAGKNTIHQSETVEQLPPNGSSTMQPGEHSISEQVLHKLACNNAPTITHFVATLSSPKTPKGKRKHLPSITSLFHHHDGISKRPHQSGQEVICIDDEDIEVQGNNAGSPPKFSDQQPSKSAGKNTKHQSETVEQLPPNWSSTMQPGEHSVSEQELHKLACNNAPTITHFVATLSSPKTPKGKRKHLPSITSLFHHHDGISKRPHQSGQEVICIDDEDIEVQGNNAGSAPKFSDQQPSKSAGKNTKHQSETLEQLPPNWSSTMQPGEHSVSEQELHKLACNNAPTITHFVATLSSPKTPKGKRKHLPSITSLFHHHDGISKRPHQSGQEVICIDDEDIEVQGNNAGSAPKFSDQQPSKSAGKNTKHQSETLEQLPPNWSSTMQPGEHSVSEQELHKLACNNAPTITHFVATLSSPKTPKGKRKHLPSITSLFHHHDGISKRPHQSGQEVICIDDEDIEVQGNNAGSAPKFSDQQPSKSAGKNTKHQSETLEQLPPNWSSTMQPGEHSVSEQELHKLACNNAPTITHFVATLSSPKTPKGKRKHLPSITSLFHHHDGISKRPHQSGQEVICIDDEDIEVQGNNAGSAPKFSDQQPSKSAGKNTKHQSETLEQLPPNWSSTMQPGEHSVSEQELHKLACNNAPTITHFVATLSSPKTPKGKRKHLPSITSLFHHHDGISKRPHQSGQEVICIDDEDIEVQGNNAGSAPKFSDQQPSKSAGKNTKHQSETLEQLPPNWSSTMQPGEHSVSEQELHKLACNNAPTITHFVATLSSPKTPKGKRKHLPSITSLFHHHDGISKRPHQSGQEVICIDNEDIEVQGNNAGSAPKFSDQQPSKLAGKNTKHQSETLEQLPPNWSEGCSTVSL
nr:methyl-CpG-binding domain-containing protein 2-like isoform X2 [Ipomoea batatas]